MPMRWLSLRLGLWLALTSAMLAAQPFPDAHEPPLPGWTGPVFRLSQSYPPQPPAPGPLPWSAIDFRKEPERYMKTVLAYASDGNVEVDWDMEKKSSHKWYHAPWLHWGEGGREFVHGMTRERPSLPLELAATQTTTAQTWAVSLYNDLGGYTLGQVWANPNAPNPAAAHFAPGTVAVKLLFTDALPRDVPYLAGSKEWHAYVAPGSEPRAITLLRLLQVDFAVRDDRAQETGWVFGTFQYDRDAPGVTPWARLVPVSLTWGNDPRFTLLEFDGGARPAQSWIYHQAPTVRYRESIGQGLGWLGRANGPVDNQLSSCLSCHATAQYPATLPMAPDPKLSDREKLLWFQNLKTGGSLDPQRAQGLDYSLQLAAGISNFYSWGEMVRNLGVVPATPAADAKPALLQPDPKDGAVAVYGVSRDEKEQKAIRMLSLPLEGVRPR